ncbi:MAG: glycosyltransferase family 4 protein, partial [Balneolales bacterium]|nr:glycosyltransferase family 4 protein [Balneolales bacterium]
MSVPGGVRTHILDLCATLRDKGHQISIVGSTNGKTIETDLPILDVGSGWRMPLWGTVIDVLTLSKADKSSLRRFFEENRVDVLHFHTPWTPLMSIQLLKLVRSLPPNIRPKLVATFHDTPPDSLWGRFLGRYIMPTAASVLLQKFDRIISVSHSQKAFISRYSDKKIDVISNGFRFRPEELNTELSNVPNPRELPQTILFLGRLEPRKGVMHALKV